METEVKDFLDVLKDNLNSYEGTYDTFIDYSPDLFVLLTELLNLKEVNTHERLRISAAIAYFVVPYDVIPEKIYGPYGYVDDIYVSTYVIKEIARKLGYDQLQELWPGNRNLREIVDLCYYKSKKMIAEDEEKILEYVGIR